jgi:kynurenine formamidase
MRRVRLATPLVVTLMALMSAGCQTQAEPGETRAERSTGAEAVSALDFPQGTLVDLSYAYSDETIYWPTAPGFNKTTDFEGTTEGGYYYTAYSVATAEHGGTHLDAPIHFAEGRQTADQIPLDRLMGPAVLVDVSEAALADRDYLIGVGDVQAWEARHGAIPDGSILLFRTGYGRFWPDAEAYMGTAERGQEAVAKLHFPGIDPELATWLVENRNIDAVGIDTPSIDYGQSTLFESHRILYAENIPGFENVANMDLLPETGFLVIALPMKIEGGSGGPLRMVAVVP